MRMSNAEVMKRRNLKIKLRAFKAYSGGDIKCYCCGETIIEMLSLDHVEGGGNEHRVALGGRKDWADRTCIGGSHIRTSPQDSEWLASTATSEAP